MVSVIGPLAKYYNLSWGKLEWYVENLLVTKPSVIQLPFIFSCWPSEINAF